MKKFICVLCNKEINGEWGNNPSPLTSDGLCCDKCNKEKVIVERLKNLFK